MQLSFLGQAYDASLAAVSAITTSETGTFLGRPYARKHYTVAQRRTSTEELTYRGRRYTP